MTWKYPDRNPIQPENEEKEMEMKLWIFKTAAKFPAKCAFWLWIGLMVLAVLPGGCSDEDKRGVPEIVGRTARRLL